MIIYYLRTYTVREGLELSPLGESPPEGGVAALPTTLAGHDSSTGS